MNTRFQASDPTVPRPRAMTAADLYGTLGLPQAPLLLDVRRAAAFAESARMLPGCLRVPPEQVAQWAARQSRTRRVVACCVHGHEVGQGAAATLAGLGFDAHYLEGGVEGWIAAGLPSIARRPDLGVGAEAGSASRWVTRARPKIDRLACPWLLRRFIDPQAEFLYVEASAVRSQAAAMQAIPYDIPDTLISHRGPHCSFDALLAEFGLCDPALDALAQIVRAADTGLPETVPQASGLLAISIGLGHCIGDDAALLEAAMPVYDALYAWCKLARDEVHNWPFGQRLMETA